MVVGANRHDVTQVAAVLGGKAVGQLDCASVVVENLCADKAYDSAEARAIMQDHNYIPHVRSRGEEIEAKTDDPTYKARRWVIEVSHSWYNLFRKLTIRYEKKVCNWIALHNLAAAVIALRKITLPGGKNFIYG